MHIVANLGLEMALSASFRCTVLICFTLLSEALFHRYVHLHNCMKIHPCVPYN